MSRSLLSAVRRVGPCCPQGMSRSLRSAEKRKNEPFSQTLIFLTSSLGSSSHFPSRFLLIATLTDSMDPPTYPSQLSLPLIPFPFCSPLPPCASLSLSLSLP